MSACDAARHQIGPGDPGWPAQVPRTGVAKALYVLGDPAALAGPCVSVVGARRGTPYGTAVAAMAGRLAAEAGLVLVSGGAMGVDAAAARAALAAGGRSVVVAGTGADRVYPASSSDVFAESVARGGAVVSLEHWGSPPRRYAFPRRNRLIAALSPVLVVTEAGLPSGTFSTADAALELDRKIYAAPGSMFSPYSRGTNRLIEQGAAILADEASFELALCMDYGVLRTQHDIPATERGRLLSALVAQPLRPDDLAVYLGISVLDTVRCLSEHEVEGLVVRLPDGRYAPTERVLLGQA